MGPRHPFGVKESPADREARFRAWWSGLTPEQRRAEVKAGHVRVNLPARPEKPQKRRKRTRAAQARSAEVEAMTAEHGESYVHMTPNQRFGVNLRAFVAKRDAFIEANGSGGLRDFGAGSL